MPAESGIRTLALCLDTPIGSLARACRKSNRKLDYSHGQIDAKEKREPSSSWLLGTRKALQG
jgi:hypothetical protein